MTEVQRPPPVNTTIVEQSHDPISSGTADLLPEPELGSAGVVELEVMLLGLKRKDKEFARERQSMAEATIDMAVQKVVKDMQARADYQLVAGLVSGFSQVAAGGLSMTGGFKGLSGDPSTAAATAAIWTGASDLAKAGGTVDSMLINSGASAAEIRVTQGNAQLNSAERDASAAHEATQEASQDYRETLARVDRIVQADVGAQQAALFRA
ncbi:MAG: hypothetical protein RJA70_2747 [Pseudomonadota bacterium]|jgi:hypothetical protein